MRAGIDRLSITVQGLLALKMSSFRCSKKTMRNLRQFGGLAMLVLCAKVYGLYANLDRFVSFTGKSFAESRRLTSLGRSPRKGRDFLDRRNLLRKLRDDAGVKRFGFHGIRHLAAHIAILTESMTLPDIQHLLRHKSILTAQTYVKQVRKGAKASEVLGDYLKSATWVCHTAVNEGEARKKGSQQPTEIPYLLLARPMGLEPTASGVTGRT